MITGICALAAAAAAQRHARLAFIALGLTLPGLLLQDSWRYAFFALGRGSQALLNDTVWAVSMLPALVVLRITDHTPSSGSSCLGCGGHGRRLHRSAAGAGYSPGCRRLGVGVAPS